MTPKAIFAGASGLSSSFVEGWRKPVEDIANQLSRRIPGTVSEAFIWNDRDEALDWIRAVDPSGRAPTMLWGHSNGVHFALKLAEELAPRPVTVVSLDKHFDVPPVISPRLPANVVRLVDLQGRFDRVTVPKDHPALKAGRVAHFHHPDLSHLEILHSDKVRKVLFETARAVAASASPAAPARKEPAMKSAALPADFAACLPVVLKHEGGWADHPSDPGGATMKGITIGTFRDWRGATVTKDELRRITDAEVTAIYRQKYWDRLRCGALPPGLDLAVFDFGVNSGPKRAAQFLQRIVGVAADGIIGPVTLRAVWKHEGADLADALCDRRMTFLQGLKTWPTFGKGWRRRVSDVRQRALALAASPPLAKRAPADAAPPAPRPATPVVDRGAVGRRTGGRRVRHDTRQGEQVLQGEILRGLPALTGGAGAVAAVLSAIHMLVNTMADERAAGNAKGNAMENAKPWWQSAPPPATPILQGEILRGLPAPSGGAGDVAAVLSAIHMLVNTMAAERAAANAKGKAMENVKPWWQSKAVWGGIAAVVFSMAPAFGVSIDLETQGVIVSNIEAIAAALAGLYAVYGRFVAKDRLS